MADLPPSNRYRKGPNGSVDVSLNGRLKRERERVFEKLTQALNRGEEGIHIRVDEWDVENVIMREIQDKGYYVERKPVYDMRYKDGIRHYDGFLVYTDKPYKVRVEEERQKQEQLQNQRKYQAEHEEKQRREAINKANHEREQARFNRGCWIWLTILFFIPAILSILFDFIKP